MLRGRDRRSLREVLAALEPIRGKLPAQVRVAIDIDPVHLL
jgi:hypothetical protein